MNNPLVSIIIPTYNRAHFLGETLDSVIAQTYQNWECIVVDDGSTDYTEELMRFYCKKDARIQYHHRPDDKPKGGNACRNYGLELSEGEYVNWFDSDDLMLSTKIESKLRAFLPELDFVISNSLNFDDKYNFTRPYPLNYQLKITPENFISQKIGWITNDAMLRKASIKIRFNENLKSGQEYNFFSRYLYDTTKGRYIMKDLSYRREHKETIHKKNIDNNFKTNKEYLKNELILLRDLHYSLNKTLKDRSLRRIVRFSYLVVEPFSVNYSQFFVFKEIFLSKKIVASFTYFTWILINLFIGQGYLLIKFSLKNI